MDETLIHKLGLREAMRGTVLFPPAGLLERISHPGLRLDAGGDLDFLLLFVSSLDELEKRFIAAHHRLRYDGIFWVGFPKPGAPTYDLSNDRGWSCITRRGLAQVNQVSLDRNWAAMRFRPRERIAR